MVARHDARPARHNTLVAALVAAPDRGSLSAAARNLALADVPVFPCAPGAKRPMTARGFHDASANPLRVEAWWQRWPRANIGVPTGRASGVVVVDVDVHGADGYASCRRAANAGLIGTPAVVVRTPTGGSHLYFSADPTFEQRSWQAGRAGVDFRGDGGYVIVPPSLRFIDDGEIAYGVESVNRGLSAPVDAQRLRDFLDPRPMQRRLPAGMVGRDDAERLARWLDRQDTDRNLKLFWAACRLAESGVPAADALDALIVSAKSDFGPREITSTVRSAYRTVGRIPAWGASSSGESPRAAAQWRGQTASASEPSRVRGLW